MALNLSLFSLYLKLLSYSVIWFHWEIFAVKSLTGSMI